MNELQEIVLAINNLKSNILKEYPGLYIFVSQASVCDYVKVRNDYLSPSVFKRVESKKRYTDILLKIEKIDFDKFVSHLLYKQKNHV